MCITHFIDGHFSQCSLVKKVTWLAVHELSGLFKVSLLFATACLVFAGVNNQALADEYSVSENQFDWSEAPPVTSPPRPGTFSKNLFKIF